MFKTLLLKSLQIGFVFPFCSDSVTDEVIGTHFIDLSRISNDGANGKFANVVRGIPVWFI